MNGLTCILLSFFLLTANATLAITNEEENNYKQLDSLALAAETDKSSIIHNYTQIYAQYFDKYKNKAIKFCEIGILKGNSVKLWENYFPFAELHFIEIDSSNIQYQSQRSQYHFLDQTDKSALLLFAKNTGGDFDIIIDDGGHHMDQQIISFQSLFPYVKSGGMYIIEDLHTSYWNDWGGNGTQLLPKAGPGTAVYFLQNLVDDLNYTGAVTGLADHRKISSSLKSTLNEYQDKIYSIHFYNSLCIILKR